MKLPHPFFAGVLLGFVLLTAHAPMQAATAVQPSVTFTVPVKLTSYSGTWASVWCELLDRNGKGVAAGFQDVRVAAGTGAYDSNVQVQVNYMANAAGSLSGGWRCAVTAPVPDAYGPGGAVGKYTSIPAVPTLGVISGRF